MSEAIDRLGEFHAVANTREWRSENREWTKQESAIIHPHSGVETNTGCGEEFAFGPTGTMLATQE